MERTILSIDNIEYDIYPQQNGELLLKPKITKVNKITNLKDYDFTASEIVSCKINNDEINKNKYKSILNYVYKIINSGTIIIKNTTLNIQTLKNNSNGFKYIKELS